MIKKYPWHFVYLVFIILALTNIFQKLEWKFPTDGIRWESTTQGLVCVKAPKDSPIKKDDILITVNKFIVTDIIDLNRVIREKKLCRYEIERDEILKNELVDIFYKFTPPSYYILVFSGLILILLTLRVLNTSLKQKKRFLPPPLYYLMGLSFAGFLIFSPTGTYNVSDFLFLFLEKVSFIFFPVFLLRYSLYFPVKSILLRKLKPGFINLAIYLAPSVILILNIFFLFNNLLDPHPETLTLTINHFRTISLSYFALYLSIALIFFLVSNLKMILRRSQKKFLFPLIGVSVSSMVMIISSFLKPTNNLYANLSLFLIVFLPLSLTYYLGSRRFTDIEEILKKTVSLSSILLFIFGIYFLLSSDIMQSRIMGIFWSMATILTAGLLFKPIEETVSRYFNRIFFRAAYNFKNKLKDLIQSLRTERDIYSLSKNFLNTINKGFQLQHSAFLIHYRKNVFYSHPRKIKVTLSKNFRGDLFKKDNLVFYPTEEFKRRYPKDYKTMNDMKCFQFLPLKTQDRLIGLVVFGLKEDDTYLSVEDWDLLFSISSSLSLSVENAFLYSELKNQVNEISMLKEFNENIIENINFGLVVLSSLNTIQTWNNVMEMKFRIPAEKAINKNAQTVFDHELWKKIYEKKQGVSAINNVLIKIDKDELIFNISISPLKDDSGKIIGTILVFEDVTEKVFIQKQLLTAEKMASLGILSAGIAHEVNTPLTGISSYCQFILDNPKDPENIDLTHKIQEQVKRANRIVRALLDFSRQQGEKPGELDLNKVIDKSISLVEHKLKKKNIDLRKEYQFTRKLFGFFTRLQHLFINLLINASDAVENSQGIIRIKSRESGSDLVVSIEDNGKGIAPADLPKIFDPFFTTKAQGKGTGLGLSISFNIVEEHFGEITAHSTINQGTTFTITFPLKNPLKSMRI
ncbi:MAG: PAS domain-containing protein [Candidatus Aminicenantes bacterium]|nr:PAS domain-containing protein [Candidatus Aminicenantes bacterium]